MPNMTPLVSILCPVYKANTAYIADLCGSILKQTYPLSALEVVFVFDGKASLSTYDQIQYMLTTKKELYDVVLHTQAHSGLKNALNRGLSLCTGKYIARIDSDDWLHPERIMKQVVFLESNPEILCVGTQVSYINSSSNRLSLCKPNYPLSNFSILLMASLYGNPICHPSVMFINNSSDWQKRSLYSYSSPYEDYEAWTYFASRGKISNMPHRLTLYRVHDAQISNSRLAYFTMLNIRLKYFVVLVSKYRITLLFIIPFLLIMAIPHPRVFRGLAR